MSDGERTARRSSRRDAAKAAAARAFDRTIRGRDLTNDAAGEVLGVNATRARRLRSDDRDDLDVSPGTHDLLLVDRETYERWLLELGLARESMHAPAALEKLEPQLARALQRCARVSLRGAEALEDGVVTPDEIPTLLEDAKAQLIELGRLVEALQRRMR
jgi:hypothetical protein